LLWGAVLSLSVWLSLDAQTGPTAQTEQVSATAPQTEQVLPSYEGQRVTSVELAGHPELDTSALESLLAQHAGEPFSRAKVNESIASLERTGKFQAVKLDIRPEAKGVRVIFVMEPAIYFGIYEFRGIDTKFAYSELLQVANYPPRGAYTALDVAEAREEIETFLHRSGYFEAQVQTSLEMHAREGLVDVIFHCTLNRRAKFGNVIIDGTTPEETEKLRHDLRSIMARLRGDDIIPGKKFTLKHLQDGTQYLNTSLMKQGYLGAKVTLIGATYDPATNRADVAFTVKTGSLIHVKVEGAHIWSWDKTKLLPIYQQAGVDQEIIQEGRQNLMSYFQSKGYFDAKVTVTTQAQAKGEAVVYQVTKGPRHNVGEVSIAGNKQVPSSQLMPAVKIQEAHLFSHGEYSDELVSTSVRNLKRVYEAEGFSSVDITPQVSKSKGNIEITFRVEEGPRNIVESLKVEGNDTQTVGQIAPKGLKLMPGKPYSQKFANEDRSQIMAHYLNMGYLNASFRETVQQAGKNSHRLDVVYHITEGPQVRIANIYTLGRRVTQQALINRTVRLYTEQPLREEQMLTAESRLYNLGIFDWAEVDPRREITTQTQEDAVVKLHESKRNVMTYGFGFQVVKRGGSVPSGTVVLPNLPAFGVSSTFKTSEQTFWGPRGIFEYTRKNIRGRAVSFSVTGLAERLDQRGALILTDPYLRGTNWSSSLSVNVEHNSENPIFTSRQANGTLQFQHALNADRTTNIFIRYIYSQTGLTNLLIPDLVPPSDQHVRLSTVAGSYIRDTRDNVLDAHKGIYESFELDLNPTVLGSNVNFARLTAQTSYYKKIPANVIWANNIRIGMEKAFSGSQVPLSELFFSGGGSTLRGFPLNGAGPQRTLLACGTPGVASTCSNITVPVGGRELFILNSEFRIPVPISLPLVDKKLSVAAFYDGGNVLPSIGFHGQYTNTIGGGVRYSTPVGPIRFDIGHNLNAPPGISSTQFFVTLGQAF
jgi:outer membrane protein insertion porin family